MLISKILTKKKSFTTAVGDVIDDLISSTFRYPERTTTLGPVLIKEDEAMRPDRLANRIYSDSSLWDVILKFNGISNPFSFEPGDIVFVPQMQVMMRSLTSPKLVPEKGTGRVANENEKALISPKTNKDKKMLEALRKKVAEIVPPNVNKTGVKNVVSRDGIVVLGGSMSQSKEANAAGSLSRSRVINNLNNSNNL